MRGSVCSLQWRRAAPVEVKLFPWWLLCTYCQCPRSIAPVADTYRAFNKNKMIEGLCISYCSNPLNDMLGYCPHGGGCLSCEGPCSSIFFWTRWESPDHCSGTLGNWGVSVVGVHTGTAPIASYTTATAGELLEFQPPISQLKIYSFC